MNELQIFENPEFGSIRTVEVDGEPWLVGKDVCAVFGDKNHNRSLRRVDAEDKKMVSITDSMGRTQQITIINESGLYALLFAMQPQKANKGGVSDAYPIEIQERIDKLKKFKRWVTSEVLPSIRKHGAYLGPKAEKKLDDLTAAVELLTERIDALAAQETSRPVPPLALPGSTEADRNVFGPVARKRWMQTVSEKLDLLSTKLNLPNNTVLSQIYKILEDKWNADLGNEQLKVMESQNLFSCSVLTAISYNDTLRDGFQKIVDFNLAPENRGW